MHGRKETHGPALLHYLQGQLSLALLDLQPKLLPLHAQPHPHLLALTARSLTLLTPTGK
jgi:hypothetical protein